MRDRTDSVKERLAFIRRREEALAGQAPTGTMFDPPGRWPADYSDGVQQQRSNCARQRLRRVVG